MRPRTLHRLQVLGAALLFSTGGAAIKATSLTAWQVASFRSGVAALALLLFLPAARRGWSPRALPVGLAYAATMILFVAGNKLTTAANTIFLQSTAPIYLLLLGPLLLGEKVGRRDVASAAVVGAGMVLFFVGAEAPAATAPNPPLGDALAAASGIAWALTVAGLRWIGRGGGASLPTVVAGNLLAFALCLAPALPVAGAGPADWAAVGYLGVFQIGLAYVLLTSALRHVPAFEASILLLLEPALNPVWAWIVHGERPGPWAVAGGVLILAGTIAKTWWDTRSPRAETVEPEAESDAEAG